MTQADDRPRILVAGGGVAALEACLALRAFLSDAELRIDLISPTVRFEYRPLSVLEAFDGDPAWSMELARFAADQDAGFLQDAVTGVDAGARTVATLSGQQLRYDRLLIAAGAEPVRAVPGAVTFRGSRDAAALREAIDTTAGPIAFVAPAGAFWTLPLYELAILTAARITGRDQHRDVLVATPEERPLEAFGAEASLLASRLLADHGVTFRGGAVPVAADAGDLELAGGARVAAGAVISLPRLRGRQLDGLACDEQGFLPVDDFGRVAGAEGVFAAGDVTDYPLKQGGLAAQQADAAAEAMLAELGLPIVPRPFAPVLQGVLYTPGEPAYLRAPVGGHAPAPRSYSLWWPPSKIAGRYLSSYLTIRGGAPRAPEVRPDADVLPVSVDLEHAVRGVRSALDAAAPVPPG